MFRKSIVIQYHSRLDVNIVSYLRTDVISAQSERRLVALQVNHILTQQELLRILKS